jgi:sterol desaturase/sphingolipid hydroxylase (fatty acid hydroxylase superfamily)
MRVEYHGGSVGETGVRIRTLPCEKSIWRPPAVRGSFASMVTFYLLVASILLVDGALLAFLAFAYHAKRFEAYRISLKESMKVPGRERIQNIAFIALLSLSAVFGMTFGVYRSTFHDHPVSTGRLAYEILAILLVYDFAYYWLHRAMHTKKGMRWVHGRHHEAHNPTAMESFYLTPYELLAGLGLLVGCTWLIGPVSIYSFALVFFIHSTLNITVHSGLLSKRILLWPIDHLTYKHYVHHAGNYDNNFASLTPFWDLLFGTSGTSVR